MVIDHDDLNVEDSKIREERESFTGPSAELSTIKAHIPHLPIQEIFQPYPIPYQRQESKLSRKQTTLNEDDAEILIRVKSQRNENGRLQHGDLDILIRDY